MSGAGQQPAPEGGAASPRPHPWLDEGRFPARRHLAAARRDHTPQLAQLMPELSCDSAVREAWAAQLCQLGQSVDAADLLLCGSDREALDLALGRLLGSDDVAIWAEPAPDAAVLAVLGAGGRYLDLGRRGDAQIDAQTAALALTAHPDAVVFTQIPGRASADDGRAWLGLTPRATVADLTWAPWPWELPDADCCVLCLRDPDRPADVVLHAVVARRGWGPGLELLHGRPVLSDGQLNRALAILHGLVADPAWLQSPLADLDALAQRFLEDCAAWPGVQQLGRLGLLAAVRCLAGDPEELGARLKNKYLALRAEPHHPGGNLLTLDLTQQLPVRAWPLDLDARPELRWRRHQTESERCHNADLEED